ncbi:MAG: hypothetical protein AAFX06_08610 [Planctomycetota bacterium]
MIALKDNSEGASLDRFALAPQANPRSEFDPTDLVHGLRRKGLPAMLLGIPLALVAAVGVFTLQEPKYQASALLRLSSQENNLVFEGREGTEFAIFQGTQKELVSTRLVAIAALRDITDSSILQQEHPVEWMMDNVVVDTPANTELMRVSVVATKSANPVDIVNATVDAYLVEVVNRERDTRQRRLVGIETVLGDKQTEARRKRSELKRIAEQLGTGDSETLSIKQQWLVQELGFVRRQIMQLKMDKWSYESKLRALEARVESSEGPASSDVLPSPSDIDAAVAGDAIYNELIRDKIATARLQSEAEASFKDNVKSPFGKVKEQIDLDLESRRDQLMQELMAFAPIREKARKRLLEKEAVRLIKEYSTEIDVIARLVQQLADDEQRLLGEFKTVGNQSIDVEMMRSEIEQLDVVIASIAQQREELKVELQSRPRVEVLRKASDLESADFVQRAALSGFAGLFCFLTPIGLFVLHDLVGNRVNSSKSLATRTGLPILGTIPMIPRRVVRHLADSNHRKATGWRLRLQESMKRLSSRIVAPSVGSHESLPQVVLITSAVRGEGKTTLANQLAECMASGSRRVILCDFDLRNPQLHLLHGLEGSPGICDILRGEAGVSDSIHDTLTPGLRILTAGDGCSAAIQALVEEKAEPLFKELRDLADLVLVDSGAVLTSADTGYLCPHVDQIVFAARRDFSRTGDQIKALQWLPATEDQILGAVVTEKSDDPVEVGHFDPTTQETT